MRQRRRTQQPQLPRKPTGTVSCISHCNLHRFTVLNLYFRLPNRNHGGMSETVDIVSTTPQIRMRDAAGWTVVCLSGTVWITQEGDSRDVVLTAGRSFTLDCTGLALINAVPCAEAGRTHLTDAMVRLMPARRPGAFLARIQTEIHRWRKVVMDAGIKPE